MTSLPENDPGDVCVVKLGGSLLDLPDLSSRWKQFHESCDDRKILLIVGGGIAADVVRAWAPLHRLSDEQAHWLAIYSLALSSRLIQELLPGTALVASRTDANHTWRRGGIPILDLATFVRAEERAALSPELIRKVPPQLPHNWDVTSDSLAAWVTLRWPARELILLKSAACPMEHTVTEASRLGLVDPYFPGLAGWIERVRWCCLRGESMTCNDWLWNGQPSGPEAGNMSSSADASSSPGSR